MNTRAFDYVVERIRPHFQRINSKLIDVVYEPMDQGGMTFIAIDDVTANEFRDFYHAFSLAKSECEEATATAYDVWWERLKTLLEKDPRFNV